MNRNHVITIVLVLLIVVLSIFVLLQDSEMDDVLDEKIYAQNPMDWIEADGIYSNIDVFEATEGRSDYDIGHQRFIDIDGSINAFYQTGSYNGTLFMMTYPIDAESYEEIIMRNYNEMNPNDGIIEGFIMARREEGKLIPYLFVDQDWKDRSGGKIYILYGDDITNKSSFWFKEFDFSNHNNGIYVDKLDYDISFLMHQNPVKGRIFLGELNIFDLKNSDYSKPFIFMG